MPIPANYILILSIFCAVYYGLFWLAKEADHWRSLFKTIPVALLAITAGLHHLNPVLILALSLSALGDQFLSREGNRAFLSGLSAFLLAHLAYIWLFFIEPGTTNYEVPTQIIALILLAAAVAAVIFKLWHYLGELKPAVLVYALTIAAMIATSLFTLQNYRLVTGVALFATSDTILAFNQFFPLKSSHEKLAAKSVWYIYFAAQLLILISYL